MVQNNDQFSKILNLKWNTPCRGRIFVTIPNVVKIDEIARETWRFNAFQNDGRPSWWISCVRIWVTHDEHLVVFSVVQKLVGINVVLLINMQVLIFYVLCFTKPIHAQKTGLGGTWLHKWAAAQMGPWKAHMYAGRNVIWCIDRHLGLRAMTQRYRKNKEERQNVGRYVKNRNSAEIYFFLITQWHIT